VGFFFFYGKKLKYDKIFKVDEMNKKDCFDEFVKSQKTGKM
jgi:hypothetical protein